MIAQKVKVNTALIITVIAVAAVLLSVLLFFVIRGFRLENALKKMDISDENTVIRVMKYGNDDVKTVMRVAQAYIDGADYSSAVKFLLYASQYLAPDDNEILSMIKDCYSHLGASKLFLSQFDTADFEISDFEESTVYEGKSYGISNGVYMTFCGGYAKAKISSILPISISACDTGVYVLDSSDRLLKYLSDTGLEVKTVYNFGINEFLYFNDTVYYIDENGVPYGERMETLNDGEKAMQLREENGNVVCSIYDSAYNKLRDVTINN